MAAAPAPVAPTGPRRLTVRPPGRAVITVQSASLAYGERTLFEDLDLTVSAGEFVAVLGPNGAGKTSLLRVLLGLASLRHGSVTVCGRPPKRAQAQVGYVPQQRAFDADLPLRGRDLVQFGLDGTRPGLARSTRRARATVDGALAAVGAGSFADDPLGRMSGGEQQRLRIAQALLTDPAVLLCDEPLLSLDPVHQQHVCRLLDQRRQEAATAVLFVTHEINPVLPYVDRVLYLAAGRWAIGQPTDVLTTATLSELYGSPVDVVHVGDRILIVGGDASASAHHVHDHPAASRGRSGWG